MTPARRYAFGFVGVVVCFTLIAAAINTWVDPLRVTPAPWSEASFEEYREISGQIRTGKAGMLRAMDHTDAAFIGSSRVANGMDPGFDGWGDQQVLNLGCSGGFLFESVGITRHLLEEDKPEVILFGIDPGDLSNPLDTRPLGDYYGSPFAPGGDRLDREIRYLIGISTLETSIEVINRRRVDQPASYTPQGLRVRSGKKPRNAKPVKRKQINFIRSRLLGEAFLGDDGMKVKPINQDKYDTLKEVLTTARTHGARVILYIHPQHAVMHARADDLLAEEHETRIVFEPERAALVKLVNEVNALDLPAVQIELWDFFGYHPINSEPLPIDGKEEMEYWNDLGHYTVEVGNTIQARLMGWPTSLPGSDSYGTRLSSENLNERLQQIRQQYRNYLSGPHARDVEWKEELFREAN